MNRHIRLHVLPMLSACIRWHGHGEACLALIELCNTFKYSTLLCLVDDVIQVSHKLLLERYATHHASICDWLQLFASVQSSCQFSLQLTLQYQQPSATNRKKIRKKVETLKVTTRYWARYDDLTIRWFAQFCSNATKRHGLTLYCSALPIVRRNRFHRVCRYSILFHPCLYTCIYIFVYALLCAYAGGDMGMSVCLFFVIWYARTSLNAPIVEDHQRE